ncbi:hypothetical protein ACFSQ7_20485 [Paenibacillus rhizoplanae]
MSLLNPDHTNIYEISDREQEQSEARRIAHSPSSTEFYVNSEMFYQTTEGKSVHLFMNNSGAVYLVDVVIYKDGKVAVYNLPAEAEYTLEELDALFLQIRPSSRQWIHLLRCRFCIWARLH